MKKNLVIAFLCGVIFTSLTLNVVQAYDLSAFTSTQQDQLNNWFVEQFGTYFDGVMSQNPAVNEGGVLKDGSGGISVKYITVTSGDPEDRRQVLITSDGIECLDDEREPVVCQKPLE